MLDVGLSGPDKSLGPVLEGSRTSRTLSSCGLSWRSAQRKGSMVQVSISSLKPLFTLSPASLLGGLCSPPPQRQRWHRPLEVTRKPRSSAEVSIEADHVLVSSLLTLGTTMPSHAPWTAATEISQELDLSPLNKGKG